MEKSHVEENSKLHLTEIEAMYVPNQKAKPTDTKQKLISEESLDQMSIMMRQKVQKGTMSDNTLDNLSKEYSIHKIPEQPIDIKKMKVLVKKANP